MGREYATPYPANARACTGASTFSHPDCTVGSGLSPDLLRETQVCCAARGLDACGAIPPVGNRAGSRRSPCPEGHAYVLGTRAAAQPVRAVPVDLPLCLLDAIMIAFDDRVCQEPFAH